VIDVAGGEEGDMGEIVAVYEGGVFRPLGPITLHEKQRVRLSIQPLEESDIGAWLGEVRRVQERIVGEHGYLSDSTPDISADRSR
jgi:predicted DNA-binding antitoxin AbrB/MazE fold protein